MKSNKIKWLTIISTLAVCLMGISYAAFTDQATIFHNVKTANMQYNFSVGEDCLNIELDSSTSDYLLNLKQGGTYSIPYSLNTKDLDNVPLKRLNNKYIGSISIDLHDVNLAQDNKGIELSSLLPSSLGTFDCYHDFDGMNGTITLLKTSDPIALELTINKSDLSQELQTEIENLLVEKTAEDNLELEEDTESAFDKEDVEIEEIIELKEVANFTMEGYYSFEIPLQFDQFNANAE